MGVCRVGVRVKGSGAKLRTPDGCHPSGVHVQTNGDGDAVPICAGLCAGLRAGLCASLDETDGQPDSRMDGQTGGWMDG
eukprot:363910-Chlamydomonas_euryale.AAC.12